MEGRSFVNRFTAWAEIGAGVFLAVVMALTFATVVLRYLFNISIPDAYDLGRNFLGIVIFWGIAVASFRGEHIKVDILWSALPPPLQRAMEIFATLFTLVCLAVLAYAMSGRVMDVLHTKEATYDTGMPIWPFYGLAWLGAIAAVALVMVRLGRELRAKDAAPEDTRTGPGI